MDLKGPILQFPPHLEILAPGNTALLYQGPMTIQTILRAAAWLLLVAIAIATLSPLGLRPSTPLPVSIERVLPFIMAGLLFAFAYPRHIVLVAAFIIIAAIGLEYLQNLRPDRHGRELDAIVKVTGAMIGLSAGWVMVHLGVRNRQR